jgi:hypothetical protein
MPRAAVAIDLEMAACHVMEAARQSPLPEAGAEALFRVRASI